MARKIVFIIVVALSMTAFGQQRALTPYFNDANCTQTCLTVFADSSAVCPCALLYNNPLIESLWDCEIIGKSQDRFFVNLSYITPEDRQEDIPEIQGWIDRGTVFVYPRALTVKDGKRYISLFERPSLMSETDLILTDTLDAEIVSKLPLFDYFTDNEGCIWFYVSILSEFENRAGWVRDKEICTSIYTTCN